MKTQRQTTPYTIERRWFYAAITAVCIAVSLYIYFVSASIHHVVMRKEIDREIVNLGSRVSELESSYIEAQHAVSEDIAMMHGFTVASEKVFIDRTETSLVLRTN